MDESESDDGVLHTLFKDRPVPEIEEALRALVRLATFRGAVPPDVRARAQALADDPLFSQADHPLIARLLAAP